MRAFQEALEDDDREVRIAGGGGLAGLDRADSAEPLLTAAESAQAWERIQLTKSCLVLAEKLAASGNGRPRRIYNRLQETRTGDSEQHVRESRPRGFGVDLHSMQPWVPPAGQDLVR